MQAAVHHFTVQQGATFTYQLTYTRDGEPVDLTSFTVRMQVRESYGSAAPVWDLASDGDGIEVDEASGVITISVAADDTAAMKARAYVYDIELEDDGIVWRLMEGTLRVKPEVTK